MPSNNIQENPESKEAYLRFFELPDRHDLGISIIQTISRGLMVSYEAARFFE